MVTSDTGQQTEPGAVLRSARQFPVDGDILLHAVLSRPVTATLYISTDVDRSQFINDG